MFISQTSRFVNGKKKKDFPLILLQEMVPDAVFLIRDHRVEIHIGNALENIGLDLWICLFQSCDQLFRLKTLGRGGTILMAFACYGVTKGMFRLTRFMIIGIKSAFIRKKRR